VIISIGRGLLHISPVMGTALINSYRLGKRERGSLLLVDSKLSGWFPSGAIEAKRRTVYNVIDWIHFSTEEIAEIEQKTGICHSPPTGLEQLANSYLAAHSSLPEEWVENTRKCNDL